MLEGCGRRGRSFGKNYEIAKKENETIFILLFGLFTVTAFML